MSPSGPPASALLRRMLGGRVFCMLLISICTIGPHSFSRHNWMAVLLNGSYRKRYATISFLPADLHASIICCASATLAHMGFSHSTCLAALAERTVYSACMLLGRMM